MTRGTKSLLFGVHQFIFHPVLVTIAWIKLYKTIPSFKELVCIFIHDWGYWGVEDIKGDTGDLHPELGAKIASWLFGEEWKNFILGHSNFYAIKNNIKISHLMAPDKYWHCFTPFWFYKYVLGTLSGELEYYKNLTNARKVSNENIDDKDWYEKLRTICLKKVKREWKYRSTNKV